MTTTAGTITVRNLGSKKAEVEIYDTIGKNFLSDGVTAKQFSQDLKNAGDVDEIDVRINSQGGSVVEGLAIYNTLKNHPAKKTVYVDGFAASMASGIAMAGDSVVMAENALMMVHNPQDFASGDAGEMRRKADILDKVKDSLTTAYVDKSGQSKEEIETLMNNETWFDADEAIEFGFADSKGEAVETATNSLEINRDCKVPAYLSGAFYNLCKPIKEVKPMASESSETKAPTEPVAAQVHEIKNLKGIENVGPEFILNQVEKGHTLDQVKDALNDEILNQLSAEKEAREKAEAESAKNSTDGVDPLNTSTPANGEPQEAAPVIDNKLEARNLINQELQERQQSGMFNGPAGFNHLQAMHDLKNKRPELFNLEPAVLQKK